MSANNKSSVSSSPADKKAAIAALDKALSVCPATPWKAKAAIHPEGNFDFAVSYVWAKAPDADKAVQVSPSVTVEPGKSVGLRIQLSSSAGNLTESFSVWLDQAKGESVWIGLGPVLQALESNALTDYKSVEALINLKATFTVRHEVVPARDKFPAYKRATIRPASKKK
jgi:hypothetical protein